VLQDRQNAGTSRGLLLPLRIYRKTSGLLVSMPRPSRDKNIRGTKPTLTTSTQGGGSNANPSQWGSKAGSARSLQQRPTAAQLAKSERLKKRMKAGGIRILCYAKSFWGAHSAAADWAWAATATLTLHWTWANHTWKRLLYTSILLAHLVCAPKCFDASTAVPSASAIWHSPF
jgi:hypothetical protein